MTRIRLRFVRVFIAISVVLFALAAGLHAADAPKADAAKPGEPTDPKARKTFASAIDWERHRDKASAISDFRKANKQDGGHCAECLRRAFLLALDIGAYKDAVEIAREALAAAQTDADKASTHYMLAVSLQREGLDGKKEKCFEESCDEFKSAIELNPKLAAAHYAMGVSLAHLHQDEAARAEFSTFLERDKENGIVHERAQRYLERVELARAKIAPPFSLTTLDGRHLSLDSLAGKVVLLDFWATWCGPCREALPHIKRIAEKFDGQPLVVISISLDKDEDKWKEFVGRNGMNWMQYRDGGFGGSIARQFAVNAIPATFTIDADGVLEDQHVGDGDIEGKLKKLVARAAEVASRKPAPATPDKPAGTSE